jgi:ligand-binding SRPBCC domain-containing protein
MYQIFIPMAVHTLIRHTFVPEPIDRVFDFFSRAGNLETITPPFLRFRILTPSPIAMRPGTLIEYALRVHGIPMRWLTRIEEWDPPHRFVDVQLRGPYRLWRHSHCFVPIDGGTEMTDTVEYALPFGPLGALIHYFVVAREIRSIFDYRAARIGRLIPGLEVVPNDKISGQ